MVLTSLTFFSKEPVLSVAEVLEVTARGENISAFVALNLSNGALTEWSRSLTDENFSIELSIGRFLVDSLSTREYQLIRAFVAIGH